MMIDIQQLQNDKLNIINWISKLQDYSLIEKIKFIMRSEEECMLSDMQKNAITEALQSFETKGATPHNIVMEDTKKRYPHLFNQ